MRTGLWVAALLVVGCGPSEPMAGLPGGASTPALEAAALAPAPLGSASPLPLPAGATTSLRLTSGPGGVVLSWISEGDERGLRAARWTDAGWGPELDVTRRPGLLTSWADAPTVVAGTKHLVAAWIEEVPGAHAMYLWASRSTDLGVSWSEPVRVHEDTSTTEHGFATLSPYDDGSTVVAWLDGRGHARQSKETALLRRTLRADGRLSPEVVVDPRTCDCCPTAGAVLASGDLLLAWRDRIGGEVRDVSTARLAEGAKTARVHEDGWEFAGCPVNGPGLAPLGDGAVVSWYTEAGGPRVRVARSLDGSTWSGVEDVAGGHGVLGRTSLLPLGDHVLVSWVEKTGDRARLMGRAVTAQGMGAAVVLGDTNPSRSAGFPSMAHIGEQVLIVSAGEGRLVSPPLP